jgi:hypothetical protein
MMKTTTLFPWAVLLLASVFGPSAYSGSQECTTIDQCIEGCADSAATMASCIPTVKKRFDSGKGNCKSSPEGKSCICFMPKRNCQYVEEGPTKKQMETIDSLPDTSLTPDQVILPNGESLESYAKRRRLSVPKDPEPVRQ